MRQIAAAVICVVGLGTAASAAPRSISKIELRAQPPRAVAQRVMRQVADILVESNRPQSGRAPVRPLTDISFWTLVRPTGTASLCASDEVRVSFSPIGTGERGAATEVRADGVQATTHYRFMTGPRRALEQRGAPVGSDPSGCRKLPADGVGFFAAEDESLALDAADRLNELLTHPGAYPIECHAGRLSTFCEEPLKGLSLEAIDMVSRCRADQGAPRLMACWQIDTFDKRFEIQGSDQPAGQRIWKVRAEEMIVLWHERID